MILVTRLLSWNSSSFCTTRSVFGCVNDARGILTHITKAKLKTKLNPIDSYCYMCHLRTKFNEKDSFSIPRKIQIKFHQLTAQYTMGF